MYLIGSVYAKTVGLVYSMTLSSTWTTYARLLTSSGMAAFIDATYGKT